MSDGIFIGLGAPDKDGGVPQTLNLRRANRHGLIAGATGTGKTVTLQGIAESFSALGVPVFLADVKGDLAGISMAGSPTAKNADKLVARAAEVGIADYSYADNPAIFWDLYGEQGHPIRTTVSEMGPLLLARLMGLNETQEGVLSIAFKYADEEGLLLLDLGDLQAMLAYCAENADTLSARYGNVTKASVGAIQRQLLQLESQGGDHFFGEPALDIHDMLQVDEKGRGYVNILAADKLMQSPKLYATFLLWLLSELFETLPEVGDPDKPKLRRSASAVRRRAQGADRQDRAGGAPDPVERRGRLFRDAEPDRYSRGCGRTAGQPGAACAACLHPARSAGDQGGGGNLPHQSRPECRDGDHRTEGGRGAGVAVAGGWIARHRPAHADRPAPVATGAAGAQGARDHPVDFALCGEI
jgi:hypothetical protein